PAAIAEFQTALAEHPERVGALQGLAIAQYKTGALADAAAKLDQVLDQAPQNGTALLYGGLVALQQKQDELAAERLARFRALEPDPRFGAQVDRALALVQTQPVSDEVRTCVATSLQHAPRATRAPGRAPSGPDVAPTPPGARPAPAKPGRAPIAREQPRNGPPTPLRSARPGEARARLDCPRAAPKWPPTPPSARHAPAKPGRPSIAREQPRNGPPTPPRSERPRGRGGLLDPTLLDVAPLHQEAAVARELGASGLF